MSRTPDNSVVRVATTLVKFWPLVTAVALCGATAIRADDQLRDVSGRVDYIYANGAPVVAVRLVRIETTQQAQSDTLQRIEDKIDDLDRRSRDRNLKNL